MGNGSIDQSTDFAKLCLEDRQLMALRTQVYIDIMRLYLFNSLCKIDCYISLKISLLGIFLGRSRIFSS